MPVSFLRGSIKLPNTTEAAILAILLNGERYGLEIREQYHKRTGHRMPYGSLYTTLHRIEDKGFIRARYGASTHRRGGNRRKYFSLTAKGSSALDALERWMARIQMVSANA